MFCGYLVRWSPHPNKSVFQKHIVKWLFTLVLVYREMHLSLPTVWFLLPLKQCHKKAMSQKITPYVQLLWGRWEESHAQDVTSDVWFLHTQPHCSAVSINVSLRCFSWRYTTANFKGWHSIDKDEGTTYISIN